MESRRSRRISTLAALPLTLAALLSSSPAGAQNADPAGATNQVFVAMNQERAKNGTAALTRHCDLDTAAQRHVNDMVAKNFLNHTGSDGSGPGKRIAETGYPSGTWGENIYGGTNPTAESAMGFWMNSTGHRGNILNSSYTQVGIAYAFGPNTSYKNYWCVVFGGGGGRQCPPTTTPTTTPTAVQSRALGGGVLSMAPLYYGLSSSASRVYVFAVGTDNAGWYQARQATATAWEGWKSLGGVLRGAAVPGVIDASVPAVFGRGSDNAVWYRSLTGFGFNPTNNTGEDAFSPWTSLGGIVTGDPVVATNADGRAQVFVRGTDSAVYTNWQTARGSGAWSGWASMGGLLPGAPAVAMDSAGRLHVFHRGNNFGLWVRRQTSNSSTGSWTNDWQHLGGNLAGNVTGDPVVTRLADLRLAAFYRTASNTVAVRCQAAPASDNWTNEISLGVPPGGVTGKPSVVIDKQGRLQLFIRDASNRVARRVSNSTDPGAGWSDWTVLQFASAQDPAAIQLTGDGSVSLFAVDGTRAVWELLPR
jgi:uncharacterized protein YkwD